MTSTSRTAEPAAKGMAIRTLLAKRHLRLVLFSVVVAALGLMISGAITLRGYALANVKLATQTISYTVEPAIYFGDHKAATKALDQAASIHTIHKVVILDAKQKLFVNWQRRGDDNSSGDFSEILLPEPEALPIIVDGDIIGYVKVYASSEALESYAISGIIIGLCALGLAIIATHILARRLEEEVVAPIEKLGAIAHEVREKRNFDLRAEPSGLIEIDGLVHDINALLGELQGWQSGLLSENSALAHKADHDPLTGLGNRQFMERTLQETIDEASRENKRFAVFFIDSDGFKSINDEFGHFVGDMTLCSVADRLRRAVGNNDNLFRMGGDEFAIILKNIQGEDDVEIVRDRIKKYMAEPFVLGLGKQRNMSASIGSALYPDDGADAQLLINEADRKMYERKRQANDR